MTEINDFTPDNRRIKVKAFLPAVVLATSLYYSFSFTTGIVIGYVLCRMFCKLFLNHGDNINGKIDKVFVDFGKWKLHLHHWIMGIIVLAIVWVIDYFYLPTFFAGAICGVIMQDIYDYNDWHKVLVKNDEYQKRD